MNPAEGAILVTGANGFLGLALCRHLRECGFEVRALVRRPQDWEQSGLAGGVLAFRFELAGEVDEAAFEGRPAALIHCARSMLGSTGPEPRANNLEALDVLLALSRRHHCGRFVFISSLSAHDEAESVYGREKLEAERRLSPADALVIRPGLIVGNGGLFGRMRSSIERRPLVPLFFGGRQRIQHIALNDICTAIERALTLDLAGRLDIAHPEPTGIREFYRAVAASVGRDCRFIRLPGSLALTLLRGLERLSFRGLPVTSDNLLGLRRMRVFDTRGSLAKLGLQTLGLEAALQEMQDKHRIPHVEYP